MSFKETVESLSREERFMATVSAMNTLMIQKGIYTTEEFQTYYTQWAEAQKRRPEKERTGWGAWLSRAASFFF